MLETGLLEKVQETAYEVRTAGLLAVEQYGAEELNTVNTLDDLHMPPGA
jgi:hypothetical protein